MAKGRKPGGRQRGTPNRVTADVKEACAALVDDPAYRRGLAERLKSGKLAPALECMLWYFANGKPREFIATGDQHIVVSWQSPGSSDWTDLNVCVASPACIARVGSVRSQLLGLMACYGIATAVRRI